MKTRSQRRKEKREKLSQTNRVKRLKKRLGQIASRNFARQEDAHMTSLMESYILRRKKARAEEKLKVAQERGEKGPSPTAGEVDGGSGVKGKVEKRNTSKKPPSQGGSSYSSDTRTNRARKGSFHHSNRANSRRGYTRALY